MGHSKAGDLLYPQGCLCCKPSCLKPVRPTSSFTPAYNPGQSGVIVVWFLGGINRDPSGSAALQRRLLIVDRAGAAHTASSAGIGRTAHNRSYEICYPVIKAVLTRLDT